MKNLFILTALIVSLQAAPGFTSELTAEEGQTFTNAAKEAKPGLLKQIKQARQEYKQWKRETSNHKEIISALKKLRKKISNKDSFEALALLQAHKDCEKQSGSCSEKMNNAMRMVMDKNHTELAGLKLKLNNVPRDIASSGLSTFNCNSFDRMNQREWLDKNSAGYHLGILGEDTYCGLKVFGPGLQVRIANNVMVCATDIGYINAGAFASVTVGVGLSTGIFFGGNGVCLLIAPAAGIGAAAGVAVVDTQDWD